MDRCACDIDYLDPDCTNLEHILPPELRRNGRWLYGVLAERHGKTRTWTIETTVEAAQSVIDDGLVPDEYENPRVMKRWESEWTEIE